MKRARVLIIAAMLALVSLAGAAAPVFADTQNPAGCGTDTSRIRLWENSTTDTSDGNDSYWLCGADSDLNNNSHTLPGNCNYGGGGWPHWNDCVSSVTVYVPSNNNLCMYGNAGYDNLLKTYTSAQNGQRLNVASSWNDGLSSFKWVVGNCPGL